MLLSNFMAVVISLYCKGNMFLDQLIPGLKVTILYLCSCGVQTNLESITCVYCKELPSLYIARTLKFAEHLR